MSDYGLISGRYRVSGVLGEGTFTDVFKADDTVLERKVAVKVLNEELSREALINGRFSLDARLLTDLVHEHVVHVLDVGSAVLDPSTGTKRPYVVMERVTGLNLSQLIERGPLKFTEANRILSEILSALDTAHRKGLTHLGLSPANVLIATNGATKVADFGISAGIRQELGGGFQDVQRDFAAPEVLAGQPGDARSDIFSAGALFFTMLTGTSAFPGGYRGSRAPAASSINTRVPPAVDIVLAQALEPSAEFRFASAHEFLVALASIRDIEAEPLLSATPPMLGSVGVTAGVAADTSRMGSVGILDVRDDDLDLPPTERMEALPPTETDKLIAMFGRNAVSEDSTFEASLPEKRRRRGRLALGLVVSLVFVVVISMVTLWVLNIKPVDFFPSSSRTIPNVVGFKYDAAAAAIADAGLTPVRVNEANAKVPINSVIRTDPSADKHVDIGTRVTLYVSSGLAEIQVPNVSGMSVEAATAELTKAGFAVGGTSKGNSASFPQGTVISTTPAAGAPLKTGEKVTLLVSSGQVTIPDLTGKKIDEAAAILSASDIMLTPSLQADPSCKPGAEGVVVISQSVGPGDVPTGTSITLVYCAG